MATSAELVDAVRRQGAIVASVSDDDVRKAADVEVSGIVWPFLRNLNSDFGVREVLLTPVNGRAQLPRRAVGAALRHVQTVISGAYAALPQLSLESDDGLPVGGFPAGFYLDAGAIVLVPRGTSVQLRVRYWPKPGRLVAPDDTSKTLPIFTSAAVSSTTTYVNTSGLISPEVESADIISGASHHALLAIDTTAPEDGGGAGYNVPTANLFDAPQFGDWFCVAGYTPVVPAPEELFAPLVYLTAASLQRALGYTAEADNNEAEGHRRMELARETLAPRIAGNPARLTGGLAAGMRRGWGGWGGRGWRW